MAGLTTVGFFLVTLLFSIILFVLWLRIILRYFRISNIHPAGKLIFSLTNPILGPIERLFHRGNKRFSRYDWVSLCMIILVEFIKFILLGLLTYHKIIPFVYLIVLIAADLIVQPCNLLFYALLARVLLDLLNPQWQRHPAADLLKIITDPLIKIGRKIIPNISGFDFGPFIMMIIFKIITLFISASMPLPLL